MSVSSSRRLSWLLPVAFLVIAGIGVGAFFVGRASNPPRTGSYLTGYTDGELAGVEQGRLIQGSQSLLPADAKSAKDAYARGYVDGQNDAFTLQFDGGWQFGVPYVVTLTHAGGGVVYRFAMRDTMEPNTLYYSCAKSVVCTSRNE